MTGEMFGRMLLESRRERYRCAQKIAQQILRGICQEPAYLLEQFPCLVER